MSERPLTALPTFRWWVGFFVVAAIAGYMTRLAYADALPSVFRIRHFDKVMHFAAAGLLAFFLDGALRRRALFTAAGIAVPLAAALVLVPAGIEEYLQRYSMTRTSSLGDFAADFVGVAVLTYLSRRSAQ